MGPGTVPARCGPQLGGAGCEGRERDVCLRPFGVERRRSYDEVGARDLAALKGSVRETARYPRSYRKIDRIDRGEERFASLFVGPRAGLAPPFSSALSDCEPLWESCGGHARIMKCEGCGAELSEGAKNCSGCGREVSFGQKAAGQTMHVAKETEAAAGKVGKELWGGAKALGSSAKKKLHHSDEEQKAG